MEEAAGLDGERREGRERREGVCEEEIGRGRKRGGGRKGACGRREGRGKRREWMKRREEERNSTIGRVCDGGEAVLIRKGFNDRKRWVGWS